MVQVPLKYNGGLSTNLAAYVTDSQTIANPTSRYYMNINAIPPMPPTIDDTDTSKYSPELSVLNTNMPKAYPGQSFKLSLAIVNTSYHYAKDVTITPTFQVEGENPFQFTTINPSVYINNIEGSKAAEAIFNFSVKPGTPSGIYTINLKYKFSNLYGDKYGYDGEKTESIYIKVENNNAAPKISISKINYPEGGLQTGTTVPIKLLLANKGTLAAKDIKVSLGGLKTGGFTILGNGNLASISTLYGGAEQQATFNITVSSGMVSGSHDLTANITYKDDMGNVYTEESQFFLPVTMGDPQAYGIQIQNLDSSNKTYRIDQNMPIGFKLANTGQTKLYNVKVSLTSDPVIIPKTAAVKAYNIFNPGQTEALNFVFSATKEATTRNYPIAIQVEYEIDQGGERVKQNLTQYVGVFVENKAGVGGEGNKSVPKIIINSYLSDPNIVRAGQNFNLNISFLNTNSIKTVQNIKVFFTVNESTATSGSVFTPVNSSNTFYIDTIGPKQSVEKDLEFYTIPDAIPKTYSITANFEYEDSGGNPFTATELIGIPVVQQSRLETSVISMPPVAYMGQPIPLTFEFYNMGGVALNNLMITAEGDFTNQTPNYFVGNFEKGSTDYFDTMIFPNTIGPLTGSIVFAYDDAAGEHQEIRKEFSVTVEEMSAEVLNPEFPDGEMPPDKGFPGEQPQGIMKYVKSPIVWGIAIAIILGIATIIIVKKIKKRKELTLDE